jgi:Protein of unknown function (DUF3365)
MRSHGLSHPVLGVMLFTATLGLCGSAQTPATPPEWPTYSIAQAPAALRPAIQRGDLLITALQGALISQLRRDLGAGGPSLAMRSCHLDTTGAAYRAARDEGLAAGQTSARLRNPTNAPRPWAAAIVQRYTDQPSAAVNGFVIDLGDRAGILRPIREQAMCGSCHGPHEKLSAGVRAELADRYPRDRAIGFREGDIRGWFWVEVPKR